MSNDKPKKRLRIALPEHKVRSQGCNYWQTDEIKGTYRGMMIAILPVEWCVFQNITFTELVLKLTEASFLRRTIGKLGKIKNLR